MKASFAFLFFICLLTSCDDLQQTNTKRISIEIIGDKQPDSIKLVSYNKSNGIVSKNQNPYIFNFADSINDAYAIDVFKDGELTSKKIFLGGEAITIKAKFKPGTFSIDTVIGSEIYYKSLDFYKTLGQLDKKQASDSVINSFLLSFTEANLNHPLSFEISNYYIEKNQNYTSKLVDLKSVLEKQSEALKNHTLSVHRNLEDLVKKEYINLSIFQFYNREGTITKLDLSHKGDYLLDFWFVHCPPCVRDHKKIGANLNMFSNNAVELVGISIDTESDKWLDYLESHGYNWQNYRELRKGNDLIDALDVWEFPTYILINNNGEIKTKFYSFEALENYYRAS